ncbi:hypothetical protein EOW65_17670 [Sinirhodobacter ferrireducens]|uniref:Uncharacterized protein n=1 Tax=Paenirhodobacter ferrireducens TaxID=1215032 RepID=A0A443L7B8_9RHOB|nr:hypothetical protein [Sinirhodobacter ferrireducens]RWR44973.1 hypothetical protein EOW65_17670 [Sinirhodobacter ferrireducens]
MSDMFKFTPVKMGTPEDNLRFAISILQTHILATDTGLNADVMFGGYRSDRLDLEAVVSMLAALIDVIDSVNWEVD